MMDGYVEIAKQIKKRDNPRKIGPCMGILRSKSPYTVDIFGGEYILTEGENLAVCDSVVNALVGDSILCVPEDSQNFFYAVAKIRR